MKIRIIKADISHIPEIMSAVKSAKESITWDQWQNGYPDVNAFLADLQSNSLYVAVFEERVIGVMAVLGSDSNYNTINGQWLSFGEYLSLHRICVASEFRGRGVAGAMFSFAEAYARKIGVKSVRVDTHRENLPMRNALAKNGYQFCGTIALKDGALRDAFEKIII